MPARGQTNITVFDTKSFSKSDLAMYISVCLRTLLLSKRINVKGILKSGNVHSQRKACENSDPGTLKS